MLRSIIIVLKGTLLSQAIGVLALPILTRIYAPEDLGIFQLYQSILTPLLVLAALRFEIAVLRAENEIELNAVLHLCIIFNLLLVVVVAAVCLILAFNNEFLSDTTKKIVIYLPVGVLIGGILQTTTYVALRRKNFHVTSSAKIIQATGFVGSGILLGLSFPMTGSLVVSDMLGRISSITTFLLGGIVRFRRFLVMPDKNELKRVCKKYSNLPLISLPGQIINSIGGIMTTVLMYAIFSPTVAGYYGLVEKSILLPLAMFVSAISQVFIAELADILNKNGVDGLLLFRKTIKKMFLIGILPISILTMYAPDLFVLVFGQQWSVAGDYARIIAPLLLAILVAGPVNMTITVLGWQKVQMIWEVSRFVSIGISWFFIMRLDLLPETALFIHVIVNFTLYVLYIWLADLVIRRHISQQSS